MKGAIYEMGKLMCEQEARTILYAKWRLMVDRCHKSTHQNYKNYGGRGISVCDEWRHNFDSFYSFCLKNGWASGLAIDRINNDGGYSPENCRFVTSKENSRNTRRSKWWYAYGVRFDTIEEMAELVGANVVYVSRWCRDKNNTDFYSVLKYAPDPFEGC